jgi:non-specific serine/threonine protein kinase
MRKLYEIGSLQLDPEARVLTHAGAAVPLGARGVAVLTALVSRANECVQKSAILDAAWPGLVVEEANLAVQISAVRRALALVPGGEGWIETLARRGYRFVGPVKEIAARSVAPLLANRKRTNLPESLSSFVGRERELAEIKQRLPTTRLMTLTGMGGLGKTRLAQQAAAEMLDAFRDGVWFVDLAPLGDPALVPSTLARVLQVKESAGQPLLTALCSYLRTRETLLILDNCEHVLDGCARMTEALLRDASRVTVMATSREALHLDGEFAFPLSPLPLPDPRADAKSIAHSDAVHLFTERARQHRPRLDLEAQRARVVAEICVRLDGIPLALELAAARVAVLPLEQILRLLTERFRLLTSGDRDLPRHQTLRAMLDWSYELLDDTEKKLFARLSVFAGGWTLEAASQVCSGAPITKDDLVYVLIGLIEQSLIVAEEDGDRYRMLETVRQYARDRLPEASEGERWRDRHLEYFLALAEEAEPKLNGPQQRNWLDRLESEHDNTRAALAWSLTESRNVASGLRLAGAFRMFWFVRGFFMEGRDWFSKLLAPTSGAEAIRAESRAKALDSAGTLARQQGDYAAAQGMYEESLAIWRKLGERHGMGSALNNLGTLTYLRGDYQTARVLYEESLAMRRALRDLSGIAACLHNLGNLAYLKGDCASARGLHQESLAIERELGNQWGIATSLQSLGMTLEAQGDHAAARAACDESLAIQRELGDRPGIGNSLNQLGNVACEQGDYATAQRLYEEALAIQREVGDLERISAALDNLSLVAAEQGNHVAARSLGKESLAIRSALHDRRAIAWSLEGLAYVAFALKGPAKAARIWATAARIREEVGCPLPARDRARSDRRIAAARAAMGDDAAFDGAWQEGRAMPLDRAVEYALDDRAG